MVLKDCREENWDVGGLWRSLINSVPSFPPKVWTDWEVGQRRWCTKAEYYCIFSTLENVAWIYRNMGFLITVPGLDRRSQGHFLRTVCSQKEGRRRGRVLNSWVRVRLERGHGWRGGGWRGGRLLKKEALGRDLVALAIVDCLTLNPC